MQTDYILIFVILTLGYFAARFCNFSYYRLVNYSEQELFFVSGIAGTLILILGEIIHALLIDDLQFLHTLYNESLGLEWGKFHSLSIGAIATAFLILIYNKAISPKEKTIQGLLKNNNDGLELMLLESLNNTRALAFTMSNNKVYIGLVASEPFSHKINRSFQILPLLSGYRKSDGTLELNTDYVTIYQEFDEENNLERVNHFSITLVVEDIITCSYFDIDIYDRFSKGQQKLETNP